MEGSDLTVEQAVTAVIHSQPDMIGFGGMITRFRIIRELARSLRELIPGVFMIAGNSGASTLPQLYLSSCRLDAIVKGEGEVTVVELADRVASSQDWKGVPGLCYLDDEGELKCSPTRELIREIDSLPRPAWEFFPVMRYVQSMDHRDQKVRHMEVVASRGCPYNCTYCYRIYGRNVRRRTPESIVSEIEELIERFGIEYTGFPDDLFTSDRSFVLEICKLLKERTPGLKWSCLGRVNTVDREMLEAMRDAGCDWISYGIESGSDEMLRIMGRGVTAEQCLKAIELTRAVGIHAEGSLMIGMFGETQETVQETLEFCRRADIVGPLLFITPYPGTAIYEQALREDRIDDIEGFVENMNAADNLLVNLTDMSDEQLIHLRETARRSMMKGYLLRKPFSRIPAFILRRLGLRK